MILNVFKILVPDGVIIWDVDRYIINNGIKLSYYGFLYTVSFLLSIYILKKLHRTNFETEDNLIFIIIMAISSIIGGRLGFVFFYHLEEFKHNLEDVVKIWQGGLSSHGSALGIVAGVFWFSRFKKFRYLYFLDKAFLLTLLAGFFIRLGNFFNSEKIGKKTNGDWGVIFRNSAYANEIRHPIQLYESMICLILFIFFLRLNNRVRNGYLTVFIVFSLFTLRYFNMFFFGENIIIEQNLNFTFALFSLTFFVVLKK
ncbi:prolipoprotein diacylglyceryl transferase [Lacihabitans lacunae]|uniref:Prolipoprotein diacylglyceryl transferase n=1 Tax=Lacihabitans lacunae TaxID=1028214 RepID=A0ABV7Z1G9_9BACT